MGIWFRFVFVVLTFIVTVSTACPTATPGSQERSQFVQTPRAVSLSSETCAAGLTAKRDACLLGGAVQGATRSL